jgi:hypothetical protein
MRIQTPGTRYTDKKRIHDIIAMVVAVISDFDDLI